MEEQSFSIWTFFASLLYAIIVWVVLGICIGLGLWIAGRITGWDALGGTGESIFKRAFKGRKADSNNNNTLNMEENKA